MSAFREALKALYEKLAKADAKAAAKEAQPPLVKKLNADVDETLGPLVK